MKCIAEVRFLVISVAVLMALVVPVTAATFETGGAEPESPAGAPAIASAGLLEGAPPPLICMAVGTLLVVAMVGRRARRVALAPPRRDDAS